MPSSRVSRRSVLLAIAAGAVLPPRRGVAGGACLDELLGRRRMVRRFTAAPVPDAQVRRLIAAAHRAPSAGNKQPWGFVIVRDRAQQRRLGQAAYGQMFVADAPVVIVPCADVARARKRYRARGEHYALIDTAFASLCLLLAVTEEGLGACFVGAIDEDKVARLLALSADVRPLAVIPVGHPRDHPGPSRLRPLESLMHREQWRAR